MAEITMFRLRRDHIAPVVKEGDLRRTEVAGLGPGRLQRRRQHVEHSFDAIRLPMNYPTRERDDLFKALTAKLVERVGST